LELVLKKPFSSNVFLRWLRQWLNEGFYNFLAFQKDDAEKAELK